MAHDVTSAADAQTPQRSSPREIIVAMSGLVIAILLAQLDLMIVGPALPTIVGDLGGLSHLAWVTTAYILASAVATPIWGKLGDLYGRRGVFLTTIVIFLVGSALSGAAQNMSQLSGCRALQGIGGGGLMVGVLAVLAELVPPRDRGKYQGVMMAVMPASMIGGPLVGGFITDNASWRWAFYVNLPLGAIALVVTWFTLKLPPRRSAAKVDWTGAALLTTWITALVLITSWGGTQYGWSSWQILSLGALALVAFVVFLGVERRVPEPIMPLAVFANRNFALAAALSFVVGFVMFGGITFLPQYQQFVQGASATNSGLLLLPLMSGALVLSLLAGFLTSKTGRYRHWPILGTAMLAVALYLLSMMTVHTSRTTSALFMVLLGIGMGCLMQTTVLIAQNSVGLRDVGAATGASTFLRTMGGSLGVSVLGAIYVHRLQDELAHRIGPAAGKLSASGTQLTPATVKALPDPVREAFQASVTVGIDALFFWSAVGAAVGFGLSWFIRHVPLRDGSTGPLVDEEATPVAVP
jgi:EmrB/QacA subfamily drug resistance transporter